MPRYQLATKEPGPRGLYTLAQGYLMVNPSADPENLTYVEAVLTEDEVEIAKNQNIEVKEVGGERGAEDEAAIVGTENLPAEGYIDKNHPDAQALLAGEEGAAPKVAKAAVAEKASEPSLGDDRGSPRRR